MGLFVALALQVETGDFLPPFDVVAARVSLARMSASSLRGMLLVLIRMSQT